MDVQLSKRDYFRLRSMLAFHQVYWPTGLIMLADVGLVAGALWLVNTGNWVAYATAQLIFVLVFFHNFAILHECGHGNCSKRAWVNTATGLYASIFCFMPFFPWKYIHAEHHTWAGNVHRDPTLTLVRDYDKSQRAKNFLFRLAWRSWLPVLALLQHVVLWSYPLVLLRQDRLRGKRLMRCFLSVVLLAAAYTAAAFAFPGWFSLATFGPALLVYLVAVELINFPHHLGTHLFENSQSADHKLPLWNQETVTRSCYYPAVVSSLGLMNFNFHVEHHLFPDLPWYRLREARTLVREALQSRYRESVGISWSIENRRKGFTDVVLEDVDGAARHWTLQAQQQDESEHSATATKDDDYESLLTDVRLLPTGEKSEVQEEASIKPKTTADVSSETSQ